MMLVPRADFTELPSCRVTVKSLTWIQGRGCKRALQLQKQASGHPAPQCNRPVTRVSGGHVMERSMAYKSSGGRLDRPHDFAKMDKANPRSRGGAPPSAPAAAPRSRSLAASMHHRCRQRASWAPSHVE